MFLATLVPFTVGKRRRDQEVEVSTGTGGSRLVAWVKGWGGGDGRGELEPLLRGGGDERGNSYT